MWFMLIGHMVSYTASVQSVISMDPVLNTDGVNDQGRLYSVEGVALMDCILALHGRTWTVHVRQYCSFARLRLVTEYPDFRGLAVDGWPSH